jgi:hypothetical protein
MKRRIYRQLRAALSMVVLFTAGAAAQEPPKPDEKKAEVVDISGKWDLTVQTQQGPMTTSTTFKVEDEKVTGTMQGPQGELAVNGTITATELSFSCVVNTQNGELTIAFTGAPGKDKMEGKVDFGGRGEGGWSAVRAKPQ